MVQVIPRISTKKKTNLKQLVPWLSVLLIVVVFLLYFIFSHQISRANISLEKSRTALSQAQTQSETELERKILIFRSKMKDVILLLQKRERTSRFFEFLEALVHPNVYFSSFSYDNENRRIELEGKADDFVSLGQQILVFQQQPLIQKVKLLGASLGEEGKIKFSLELSLPSKEPEQKNQL